MKRSSLLAVLTLAAVPAWAAEGDIRRSAEGRAIRGSYIVVLQDGVAARGPGGLSVPQIASEMAVRHGGTVTHSYENALSGFAARMSEKAAAALAADPRVAYVEEDQLMFAVATQTNATWGLDRIDQRDRPLNSTYVYNFTGAGVHAYIIDTGIRGTHQQFTGRMGNGFTAINDGQGTNDCNGHGTHVAGTVGGTTHGVAKGVTLHPVRVLGCTGSGSNAGVIAGVDWVTQNHVKPAVANMSLGGGVSSALDSAVNNSINAGVTYAVAAGNSNANACNSSPSRVPAALTVGSTTSTDARSSFSNFGTCVDVFAPGSSITSAWSTSNTATSTISGTSMASPHVAGVAALYLAQNGHQSPATVSAAINNNASTGRVTNAGTGSPNRLLYSIFGGATPSPSPSPSPTPTPPPGGSTVFFDGFETSTGWVRGADTATSGLWERGNPQQTSSGSVILQVENAATGTNALITGLAAGSSAGANDVDGGVTIAISPAISLPNATLTLSFNYYMAHLNNSSSADFFRVRIGNTILFQELGAADNDAAAWASASVNISAFAGQTVQLIVEAADASTASLVEAGIDDVRITAQ